MDLFLFVRNYDAELYACGKRLGEEFRLDTLRRTFTHLSFVEAEAKKREELLGQKEKLLPAPEIPHNEELIGKGEKVIGDYVKAYLRLHLPQFPEEGIW